MKKWLAVSALAIVGLLALAPAASAHEAYVLDRAFFWNEMSMPASSHAFDALKDPHNVDVTIVIATCIVIALCLNFLFRRSQAGQRASAFLERFAKYGPIIVRVTIATSFFFSAASMSFLGPELLLSQMPYAHVMQILLLVVAGCILVGFLTEAAALVAGVIFTVGFFVYGHYLLSYMNYLGEIVVLLAFGMRKWSVDGLLFGPRKLFAKYEKYSTTVVRICYGFALVFAAITVKFLHPALTIQVVNQYNLTQFHWLFPHDPLLVTLGAGLAEVVIGLFIIFGFEMRMTVLISLFYITMSLLFFREQVWPHLLLYGISINLLIQPEVFTLDHVFFDRKVSLWKRPLLPHK